MKRMHVSRRTLALIAVMVPMLALFIYVVLRSGPLAPVPVTVTAVESRSIAPALFGIGTIEARYLYKIGPVLAGRVRRVDVQVGERVQAGQLLGEMDPVDLDERLQAQTAALKRAEAASQAAEAQVREAAARKSYAVSQARRYEKLLQAQSASEEAVEAKRQERQLALAGFTAAKANRDAAQQELTRVRAERDALQQQRDHLRLVAPVDGLVAARHVDPGTTVVAGQAVVELIDPASLWINVRFDQLRAAGLRPDLPARVTLRSQGAREVGARVLRVEPLADAVTEETLAKVVFDVIPDPLPPVGELAEVTVALPSLPASMAVPNASVQRMDGRLGVWVVDDGTLHFAPTRMGAVDLDGMVQILEGVNVGERVVVYSQRSLNMRSRIKIVEQLPGVAP